MHRTTGAGNVGGQFVDEVPGVSPGTDDQEDWLNTMQEELAAIVESTGEVLNPADDGQVLAAIEAILAGALQGYQNLAFSGFGPGKPDISGRVEVDGTMVTLALATPAGAPAIDTSNWIYVSSAGAVTLDAANPPAWDVTRGGWYFGALRAVGWIRVDGSGDYRYPHFLPTEHREYIEFEDTIEIGDWDMDGTAQKGVLIDIDTSTIRSVDVIIRHDTSGDVYPLMRGNINADGTAGAEVDGHINLLDSGASAIYLRRRNGGFFDTVSFDLTPFNRGWIRIAHRAL